MQEVADAIPVVVSALSELQPDHARKVLRIVLELLGEPEDENHVEMELKIDKLTVSRTEETGDAGEPMSERIASKLVAQDWDYESALKAAKAAIRLEGKSAGLDKLLARALELGKTKHYQPKRPTAEENEIRKRVSDTMADDAADYVRRHEGCSTTDYAAKAGLTRAGALRRLKTAEELGRIRVEGQSRATRWYPA